ncbi:MAG: hypothetical protein HC923_13485 [Myxococcales bacterium]|nr:hypothetical protein [Myxococcales bacterium]
MTELELLERFVRLSWTARTESDGSDGAQLDQLQRLLRREIEGSVRGRQGSQAGPPPVSVSDARLPKDPRPPDAPETLPLLDGDELVEIDDRDVIRDATEDLRLSHDSDARASAPLPPHVSTVQLPADSAYTPRARSLFAADYFEETTVGRSAEAAEAMAEPSRLPVSEPSQDEAPTAEAAISPAPAVRRWGRPALVHRTDGSSVRGVLRRWEDERVAVATKTGEEEIREADVLVIFLGPEPGANPTEPTGDRVKVKLRNGKRLVGVALDYEEGQASFTLIPEVRTGGVDRVWVPASSVASIQLMD